MDLILAQEEELHVHVVICCSAVVEFIIINYVSNLLKWDAATEEQRTWQTVWTQPFFVFWNSLLPMGMSFVGYSCTHVHVFDASGKRL